jgi:hypothetical protein
MNKSQIQLKLIADPLQFSFANRPRFRLGIAATNRGNEVIDPELHLAKLFVNGRESRAWNLAIGNGKRETKWFALPPGDTVAMNWSTLRDSLFPVPGEYTLKLQLGNIESPVVVVRLLP